MSERRIHNPGPIPKRWLNCPPRSEQFIADKFVAFKTPLSAKFDGQVEGKCFYPYMIFDLIKTYYKVSLDYILM
jgi:mRNA-capping enzyme